MDIPNSFICPLTLEIMKDPVIITSGHTFERTSIENWFNRSDKNPVTGATMRNKTLAPNYQLRSAIEELVSTLAGRVILPSELLLEDRLSAGSEKEVFKGKFGSIDVAILRFRNTSTVGDNEAKLMVRLGHHPNLVRFLGRSRVSPDGTIIEAVGLNTPTNALVLELAPLGDLGSYLNANVENPDPSAKLSLDHRLLIAEQIADGMSVIHANGVIHRDLAARNIMVFSMDPFNIARTSVKVSDYGLSIIAPSNQGYMRTSGVTIAPIRWMPPETIRRRTWSKQSDVWSFGVLMWEILTDGEYPYGFIGDDSQVADRVVNQSLRLGKPEGCPENVWLVVQRCWLEKNDRPSFTELKILLQELRIGLISPPEAEIVLSNQADLRVVGFRTLEEEETETELPVLCYSDNYYNPKYLYEVDFSIDPDILFLGDDKPDMLEASSKYRGETKFGWFSKQTTVTMNVMKIFRVKRITLKSIKFTFSGKDIINRENKESIYYDGHRSNYSSYQFNPDSQRIQFDVTVNLGDDILITCEVYTKWKFIEKSVPIKDKIYESPPGPKISKSSLNIQAPHGKVQIDMNRLKKGILFLFIQKLLEEDDDDDGEDQANNVKTKRIEFSTLDTVDVLLKHLLPSAESTSTYRLWYQEKSIHSSIPLPIPIDTPICKLPIQIDKNLPYDWMCDLKNMNICSRPHNSSVCFVRISSYKKWIEIDPEIGLDSIKTYLQSKSTRCFNNCNLSLSCITDTEECGVIALPLNSTDDGRMQVKFTHIRPPMVQVILYPIREVYVSAMTRLGDLLQQSERFYGVYDPNATLAENGLSWEETVCHDLLGFCRNVVALDDGHCFQLFVRGITGKTSLILAKSSTDIFMLKHMISIVDHIPFPEIRVHAGGSDLEDGRTLSCYNIQKERTLYIMLRLRGSDIRIKTCIQPLGQFSPSGIPLYSFRYKTDEIDAPLQYGTMAQDLIRMGRHDAVAVNPKTGFYLVDYSKLDVDDCFVNNNEVSFEIKNKL